MATAFFASTASLIVSCESKVSAGRYGAFIRSGNKAAARAVKDAQMGIAHEIVRQPADRKRFKFPIPISS